MLMSDDNERLQVNLIFITQIINICIRAYAMNEKNVLGKQTVSGELFLVIFIRIAVSFVTSDLYKNLFERCLCY